MQNKRRSVLFVLALVVGFVVLRMAWTHTNEYIMYLLGGGVVSLAALAGSMKGI